MYVPFASFLSLGVFDADVTTDILQTCLGYVIYLTQAVIKLILFFYLQEWFPEYIAPYVYIFNSTNRIVGVPEPANFSGLSLESAYSASPTANQPGSRVYSGAQQEMRVLECLLYAWTGIMSVPEVDRLEVRKQLSATVNELLTLLTSALFTPLSTLLRYVLVFLS